MIKVFQIYLTREISTLKFIFIIFFIFLFTYILIMINLIKFIIFSNVIKINIENKLSKN